jgi:tripartite-type tricarboxylate transporter receptor subunit TctC
MAKLIPKIRIRTATSLFILCALTLLLSVIPSHAASYFEGKTITIVVGYKPGGGYDRTARLFAKYLPKYLPGNPTIIIQSMPGANSVIAANHLFSVAKPDGLTFGTFNRNLPIAQLTRVEGVKFDLTKFAWIGSAASETTVLAIRNDLPFQTFEDLRKSKQQIVVGSTGPGANTHDFPLLLEQFAGVNFKIVSGYSSSSDIMLAIERKEADARAGSYSALKTFIDRGLVRPIVRSRAPDPNIEKLPVDEDLATSPKGKAIMAIRSAPEHIGRPYVAPPGTPAETMKLLRDAFTKAAKDKELLAEADKAQMPIEYVNADDALKIIRTVLNQPPEMIQDLTKYIRFGE